MIKIKMPPMINAVMTAMSGNKSSFRSFMSKALIPPALAGGVSVSA
jgi:hypothetical protein